MYWVVSDIVDLLFFIRRHHLTRLFSMSFTERLVIFFSAMTNTLMLHFKCEYKFWKVFLEVIFRMILSRKLQLNFAIRNIVSEIQGIKRINGKTLFINFFEILRHFCKIKSLYKSTGQNVTKICSYCKSIGYIVFEIFEINRNYVFGSACIS